MMILFAPSSVGERPVCGIGARPRKLLRNRRLKTVTIRVAASVAHGTPSVVTLHKRLR
jgi:hypothetical protein